MLISYCYGIFRADFSVIKVGEREKMWLSSSEPKFKVCLSSVTKEFHHVEKGKMHHVNGRTGIITTVTNAKLHVMLSHHEDYICSSETGDMWNLPASGLNRSVKNVIRWLENSRCESGLVHEVFNWGGQAPSWMAPHGSPSLSVKSLKVGGLYLDCDSLSLKRRKITWPTADLKAWSQLHSKLWKNSHLPY